MHVCLDIAQFLSVQEGIDFPLTEVHTHILRELTEDGGWAGIYSRTDSSATPPDAVKKIPSGLVT